jgi:L-seryl-tRNA(Ser) seleniumtransferase
LDLESGERGGRGETIQRLLAELVGTEASLVVNNNAAAVLLCLSTLAAGREVIVSRGELVEIGGSFRIPEVISAGGARLVEVGTTNRTRVADYAAAIGPLTAVILRVHPSNFRITGFTERPERAALAALAHANGLVLVDDLGSGRIDPEGQRGEDDLARALQEGADLVCASGDKLLGGPQAGLVLGRKPLVDRLRKAPLYRALRVGKLVATALERTLALIRSGEGTAVSRMLALTADELEMRANQLLPSLKGLAWPPGTNLRTLAIQGETGGGSLPEQPLASYGIEIRGLSVDVLARALRAQHPAVLGRIHQGGLLLDLRTLLPGEEELLRGALGAALAGWPALG